MDVTLTVNPATPVLALAPASMSFTATAGGANPAAQTANVSNTGGGTLNWTASDNQTWLCVTPASGTGAGAVSVSTIAGLAAGTYTAPVTVTAAGATGSPKTIAVTLTVNPATPVLALAPASTVVHGDGGRRESGCPDGERVEHGRRDAQLDDERQPDLAERDACLAAPAPAALSVSTNIAGLAAGHLHRHGHGDRGRRHRLAEDGCRDADGESRLRRCWRSSPASLSFTATAGGANPAAQTVNVSNTGGGTLNWTASDNQTWLSVSPASGTGAGALSVSVEHGRPGGRDLHRHGHCDRGRRHGFAEDVP